MRIPAILILALMLATLLGGCVSEKAFDEVIQQLDNERTKAEALRNEMELLKEEKAVLASENSELRENAGSGSTDEAGLRTRIRQLQATIKQHEGTIKSLSDKAATPQAAPQPDMTWARSLAGSLRAGFKDEIRDGRMQVSLSEDRLAVMLAESLVFERDGVDITVDGEDLLVRLGEILRMAKDHEMVVGSHLDTTPIAPVMAPDFPTAWDFTGARAIEVVRFIQEETKISGKILSAAAYGSARPVASNTSEAGRSQNRRIEITVSP